MLQSNEQIKPQQTHVHFIQCEHSPGLELTCDSAGCDNTHAAANWLQHSRCEKLNNFELFFAFFLCHHESFDMETMRCNE